MLFTYGSFTLGFEALCEWPTSSYAPRACAVDWLQQYGCLIVLFCFIRMQSFRNKLRNAILLSQFRYYIIQNDRDCNVFRSLALGVCDNGYMTWLLQMDTTLYGGDTATVSVCDKEGKKKESVTQFWWHCCKGNTISTDWRKEYLFGMVIGEATPLCFPSSAWTQHDLIQLWRFGSFIAGPSTGDTEWKAEACTDKIHLIWPVLNFWAIDRFGREHGGGVVGICF